MSNHLLCSQRIVKPVLSGCEKTKEGQIDWRKHQDLRFTVFSQLYHVVHTSKRYRSIRNLSLQFHERNHWLPDECDGYILASVAGLPNGTFISWCRLVIQLTGRFPT